MSGYVKTDNNLSNGIPARHIGPETGSSGSATMTNKDGTSEGTNEASDSVPAPAAGLETPILGEDHDGGESRSFAASRRADYRDGTPTEFDKDEQTPVQQIADGGDRIKRDEDVEH